ncbi:hypothetical protein INT47_011947 [Mucor saturninus]|uniref:Uncharacterized protein n=1 Tax=Mucor saturninus TaxID=64648 RepID=A0A8H7V3Z7_9FUNG|nr:hypothetical protein INT47_011947 [Mucor saturninus]
MEMKLQSQPETFYLFLYFGQFFVTNIRNHLPQNKDSSDSSSNLHLSTTYLETIIKQEHLWKRLDHAEKDSLNELYGNMLNSNNDDSTLKQFAIKRLQNSKLLPFRKTKFLSKLYYDKDGVDLIKRLENKFGPDSIFVIGHWQLQT